MIEHKTNQLSTPFFENLNGLRFIGALAVFLFHCFTLGREIWGDFFQSPVFKSLTKVFSKGHHGVGLFFVLSGFLITYLLLNEAKKNKTINAFGFFMRRLLRIWPLYFLIVLFGFFLFPVLPFGEQTTNSFLHYGLFLSNFEEIWNGWRDSINFLTVTWSVSIEEQFYMAWVALIAVIPAFRRGKYFNWYFLLLIAVSIAFRAFGSGGERTLYFHTLSVVSDLAIGGYLSYLCFHYAIPEKIKHLARWKIVLIYLLGISTILFSRVLFVDFGIVFERIAIGLFFAFIIFEQVYCANSFFKADKLPGFFKLGEISYGLYMYHCIVIFYVQHLFVHMEWTDSLAGFIGFILMSGIVTYVISSISYRFIEKPILGLKRYFR